MVYCMSDIHGEMDRYLEMLDLIQLSDNDVLYVLGDVVDRGPNGIEVLQDIMGRANVRMLLGNHEAMLLATLGPYNEIGARDTWTRNGGGRTYRQLVYQTDTTERLRILRFIQGLPDHLEITVDGKIYHLVHGYPANNTFDRIWGRPEPPTTPPIPGKTVIVGHTPTYYLNGLLETHDESWPYEIWHGPNIIDIDCGCGQETPLRRLGCLRLDDLAEFYV